jgi:hypothetical protein
MFSPTLLASNIIVTVPGFLSLTGPTERKAGAVCAVTNSTRNQTELLRKSELTWYQAGRIAEEV